MANPTIVTHFNNPDPNAAPLNITQLVQLLNTLVMSTMNGDFLGYVIGQDPPGPDDHNKVWIKTDSVGRPVSANIWYLGAAGGSWRRVYNGMIGEIRMFSGDPGITTDWDSSGKGVVGGTYDGWAFCNGNNGTVNLSDKFIIAAHMDRSHSHPQYGADGWETFVDGATNQHTGGSDTITLTEKTSWQKHVDAVMYEWWTASASPAPHSGDLWGTKGAHPPADWDIMVPEITGNETPDPINILNPFIALGFIQFIGYAS